MITLLTPSKTMDFTAPAPDYVRTERVLFPDEASQIRAELSTYSIDEIAQLMKVSQTIAERVTEMYHDTAVHKTALWTYIGDVFKGFQATTLSQKSAEYAQQHLLIASAVYGLVRPYDAIAPYRLEMRARLSVGEARDMYQFWGTVLADYVAERPELHSECCVLSSDEYAKAVVSHLPSSVKVITPMFIDKKPSGVTSQVPIYNKMMRGVMARWIVDNQIDSLDDVTNFSAHGYSFNAKLSKPHKPAFYRPSMRPLVLA